MGRGLMVWILFLSAHCGSDGVWCGQQPRAAAVDVLGEGVGDNNTTNVTHGIRR